MSTHRPRTPLDPARNPSAGPKAEGVAAALAGPTPIPGLHHVTAIARDPRQNLDFYRGLLGLRLVKKTVNFDDPGTHHLYYGDAAGSPGSIMTFFPWPGARRGQVGTGQTSATSFSVPEASLAYWRARLAEHGVEVSEVERFGEAVLRFRDPDGLGLELVASSGEGDGREPWAGEDVSREVAIRGFDGVSLLLAEHDATATLLTEVMGFRRVGESEGRLRYESGAGGSGTRVDLVDGSAQDRGRGGAGTVHHVAFRNTDDPAQEAWRRRLGEILLWSTEVKDRQYFHSIYFREPGGVLFEMATDPPGFGFDEPLDQLGTRLRLPPWLEPERERIESALPALGPVPAEALPDDGERGAKGGR